jgi:predicted AAA+ superfamily ATPase
MSCRSFFLFGPRGVGKSTWIRTTFPEAHTFDLLDDRLYQGLLAEPGRFAAELRPLRPGSLVVLDEVQRIPGLLSEVYRNIEERRFRFVLCGSGARKLKKEGTNLLAGLKGLKRRIVVAARAARRLATADGIEVLPVRAFLDQIEASKVF